MKHLPLSSMVDLLCSKVAWRSEVVVSLARNSKAGDGEKKKNLEGGRVFWNFEIVSFVPLIMSSRAGFWGAVRLVSRLRL